MALFFIYYTEKNICIKWNFILRCISYGIEGEFTYQHSNIIELYIKYKFNVSKNAIPIEMDTN